MRRHHQWITIVILAVLLAAEVFIFRRTLRGLLSWPSLIAILEIGTILFFWHKYPTVRRLVGGNQRKKGTRLLIFVNSILLMLLFVPFSLYFLVGGTDKQLPTLAQFSIVAVTATLGGLVLTAANLEKDPLRRPEFIHVSQKLIVATVLFMIFIACILIVDLSGGIDISSPTKDLRDPLAWSRGIYFWLAAPSFYVGVFLFLWGLRDLVIALSGIDTKPELPQPSDLTETPKSGP